MSVLPAVTALLLHQSATDIWTDFCVVSAVKGGGSCGSAFSYFSTVTSQCFVYMY